MKIFQHTIILITLFIYRTLASTISVPSDTSTIQGGIDLAVNGDTVLVAEGLYFENINFMSKSITVASHFILDGDTSYITKTIINGSHSGSVDSASVIYLVSAMDSNAALVGLTITGGKGTLLEQSGQKVGGGILLQNSHLKIFNTKILTNTASDGCGIYSNKSNLKIIDSYLAGNTDEYCGSGGGVFSQNSYLYMKNTIVTDNSVEHNGGGIFSDSSEIELYNVKMRNDSACYGGAISCSNSKVIFENLVISECRALQHYWIRWNGSGGGLFCSNSIATLKNVILTDNYANNNGGGVHIKGNSVAEFKDVTIKNNFAEDCGGILINDSKIKFDDQQRCNIFLNYSMSPGWDIICHTDEIIEVVLDTFTVMIPKEYHAFPLENFEFDILNAKKLYVASNLYVSPDGDNENSGLSYSKPLRNIAFAAAYIKADSVNPQNIYLSEGIYSPTQTRESFPIKVPDYISIIGESKNGVILDAGNKNGVLHFSNNKGNRVENLTLKGGYADNGGGIFCSDSDIMISNVIMTNNTAIKDGGALYINQSSINLANTTISSNYAINGGGIGLKGNSSLSLHSERRCDMYYNHADSLGSEIYDADSNNVFIPLDTFTIKLPTKKHAFPLDHFDFDITEAKLSAINDRIEAAINATNSDSLIQYVRILSGEDSVTISDTKIRIISRHKDNPGNDFAAEYLYNKFRSFGLTTYNQVYSTTGRNIYAVQTGNVNPDKKYILCAHYDAVTEYCADDNASGIAAVLEAARLLSKFEVMNTVIYAVWDEEEQHGIGSDYFAQQAYENDENILGIINLEMLGWDGDDDGKIDIHLEHINNSDELVSIVENLNYFYDSGLIPFVVYPGVGRSDHASFWNYGYSATVFGQAFFSGDRNPYYHTPDDRIDKFDLNYFHNLSRLAVAAIAYCAFNDPITDVEEIVSFARQFQLNQNYPNPFNPSTIIPFTLPRSEQVKIVVYNTLGQKIKSLLHKILPAGYHEIKFDGNSLASGVYYYQLVAGEYREVKKMILLR